jgi:hypothetical protein
MSKKEGFCETFDCSEYDGNNPVVQAKGLINNINEMKLGKFKFDFKGVIINFRALGPKCYAANFEEYDKDGNAKLKEKASKGYAKHIIDPKGDYEKRMTLDNVPKKVFKVQTYEDAQETVRNLKEGEMLSRDKVTMTNLNSKFHTVTTDTMEKVGLAHGHDTKRFWLDDGNTSYPFGHYKTSSYSLYYPNGKHRNDPSSESESGSSVE